MISVIVGTIGSGKTLLLTYFALLHYIKGFKIYSNYMINGVEAKNIDDIQNLSNVDGKQNFFALDEFWQDIDSHNSGDFKTDLLSKQMLQSRKRHIDVMITSQAFHQIVKRVRYITSMIFVPEVVNKTPEGMPSQLRVTGFPLNKPGMSNTFYVPLIIGDLVIPEIYDSWEVVKELKGGKSQMLEDLTDKYFNAPYYKKVELRSYIELMEGKEQNFLSDRNLNRVVDYIFLLRKEEEENG